MKRKIEDVIKEGFICIDTMDGSYISCFGPVKFPISLKSTGQQVDFKWYVWKRVNKFITTDEFSNVYKEDKGVNCNSLLVYGDVDCKDFLVRVHSGCITGDVFNSMKCDCGYQLNESIRRIVENKAGMIVYLSSHEGRGIGLFSKAICNMLQEEGLDTYQANNALGYEDDERNFDDASIMIKFIRKEKSIILLSNNSLKSNWLLQKNVEIKEICQISIKPNEENLHYLTAKKLRGENIDGIL